MESYIKLVIILIAAMFMIVGTKLILIEIGNKHKDIAAIIIGAISTLVGIFVLAAI